MNEALWWLLSCVAAAGIGAGAGALLRWGWQRFRRARGPAEPRNPVADLPDVLVEGIGAALERLATGGSAVSAVIRHNHPALDPHQTLNGLRVERDRRMGRGDWLVLTAEDTLLDPVPDPASKGVGG